MLRRTDGTAAVEFALIAPVFIACVFSMIGYAIYLSASASVQNITAEAARAAVAELSTDERQLLAEQAIAISTKDLAFIDPTKVKVTVTEQPSHRYAVQVSYDATDMPIWSMFTYALPSTKSISRTTVMQVGGSL
jgi:Flp pilus assembly protein TadG